MSILLTIWWFVKRAFWFAIDNWKFVLPALLLIVSALFILRACTRPPTLDEAAIQKAQKAIAENDRRVMVEILANSAVKEADIDGSIKAAEEARRKAIEDHSRKTNAELAAELEKRLR